MSIKVKTAEIMDCCQCGMQIVVSSKSIHSLTESHRAYCPGCVPDDLKGSAIILELEQQGGTLFSKTAYLVSDL